MANQVISDAFRAEMSARTVGRESLKYWKKNCIEKEEERKEKM